MNARAQVVTIARSLGRLQQDHGLPIDPDENVKLNLNFGLVDVVYEWARGVPFYEIMQVQPRLTQGRPSQRLPESPYRFCRASSVRPKRCFVAGWTRAHA